jgi:DNA polymerase-1
MSKKFVIIDAMALAYKAYFAFITRPLITSKGEPSSAVFGFVNQIIKILEDTKPDYVAVAFDSHGKTFRHEQYAEYKGTRAEMPEDMRPQIDRIKQIVNVLNIQSYILDRYEADDIIGTAVCKAEKEGFECFVITPDKDYNQLVTDKVKIIRPGGKAGDENVVYDVQKVRDEFGFEPKQMIDYLALTGDASDNIPGVAGIGPKSATPLIQKYGSVEEIYEHIDEIEKAGIRNKLIEGKEKAFLSKSLATIHCLVPLEFDFDKTKLQRPDFDTLQNIFIELEFKTFYSRLLTFYHNQKLQEDTTTTRTAGVSKAEEEPLVEEKHENTAYDASKVKYKLISTYEEAKLLADKLQKQDLFVYDTETDGLKSYELNVAGVSFSTRPDEGYYVAINPFAVQKDLFSKYSDRLTISEFVELFKPVFENKKIKKVCQNAKFDISVLRNYGIEVENFYFDTMLASYVIDPDQKHSMDELSRKYLGYEPIPLSSLIGTKKDASKIMDLELKDISCYSCEDADVTYKLYDVLKKELENLSLNKIAYDIEFPLVPVLENMERTGIKIDVDVLKLLSADLQIKLDEYTRNIYDCCGEEFNINSPIQLQRILFDKLGLKAGKKTKTGYSTDAKSLEILKGEHEIIEMILDFRQVAKLKSTYTDSLPNLINPKTGRIHTSFSQTTASTGRLSSVDPNLQNIPIRTELGKEIRKAFVPADKDHIILSADYSQIELRIMAAICGDEALVTAFKNKEDIHRSTAALVFMVPPEEVTSEMRRRAKEVNFGILYGIGPFGLKSRLGITQNHAKEIIQTYFNTFKRVKFFMDNSIAKAQEKGYAETILGRRRILRNINSSNRVVRQFEERVAINMPIQGTAADMIKLAMINIHKALIKNKFKSKMVLQVHDELLFDARKDEIDELIPLIKELMETALPMNVPIIAETGTGDNWLDAH